MSARTDLIRNVYELANSGRDPHIWLREHTTEGSVLYAPGIAADVRGREEVGDVLERFFNEANPSYTLVRDPIEHGNFVVAFTETEVQGQRIPTCTVWRFDGDKVNGQWVIRS